MCTLYLVISCPVDIKLSTFTTSNNFYPVYFNPQTIFLITLTNYKYYSGLLRHKLKLVQYAKK